jgi:hypothetical protein
VQEGLVKKAYIGESMYEYRVRAIGNDAEAEGYLNNMAQERWALKFAFSVGDTGRAQYVHRRRITSERLPKEEGQDAGVPQ